MIPGTRKVSSVAIEWFTTMWLWKNDDNDKKWWQQQRWQRWKQCTFTEPWLSQGLYMQ